MTAGIAQFIIDINADFNQELIWQDSSGNPIDLTDYSAEMAIANVAEPTAQPNQPPQDIYYTLSSSGDTPGITFDAVNGIIYLYIPAVTTADFTFLSAVYDLVLTAPGGEITRLLQGTIRCSPGVTT